MENNQTKNDKVEKDFSILDQYKKYSKKVKKQIEKNEKFNNSNKSIYKKYLSPFTLKWYFFIPFFIGYFISLFQVWSVCGKLKATAIFNKHLNSYFLWKRIGIRFFYFVYGPLLSLIILFTAPLICGVTLSNYVQCWRYFLNIDFNQESSISLFVFLMKDALQNKGWINLVIVIFVHSFINIPVLLSWCVLHKVNDKVIRLYLLEDNLKLKITRLVVAKSSSVNRKTVDKTATNNSLSQMKININPIINTSSPILVANGSSTPNNNPVAANNIPVTINKTTSTNVQTMNQHDNKK